MTPRERINELIIQHRNTPVYITGNATETEVAIMAIIDFLDEQHEEK